MPENAATEFGLGNSPSDKQLAYDSGVMLAESPSWLATADAIGFGRQTVQSFNSRNCAAVLL